MKRWSTCLTLCAAFLLPLALPAQPELANILHPTAEIEQHLAAMPFSIFRMTDLRFDGDITKRAILRFGDLTHIQVKWRRCIAGADAFNNQPRYEVAAYALQKLFLDEDEYVVPPTVIRGFPAAVYDTLDAGAIITFKNPDVVFIVLQYWLEEVSTKDVFDPRRLKSDSLYARHFANANLLTYLIKHADSNEGNLLISTIPDQPRVFAVDNGVSFGSQESNRGILWQRMQVNRVPRRSIERLRDLRKSDLEATLAVVAQFELSDTAVQVVPPGQWLKKNAGVRREGNTLQFGLTQREIDETWKRLEALLRRVEKGELTLF